MLFLGNAIFCRVEYNTRAGACAIDAIKLLAALIFIKLVKSWNWSPNGSATTVWQTMKDINKKNGSQSRLLVAQADAQIAAQPIKANRTDALWGATAHSPHYFRESYE
jgi:hypothetical protein